MTKHVTVRIDVSLPDDYEGPGIEPDLRDILKEALEQADGPRHALRTCRLDGGGGGVMTLTLQHSSLAGDGVSEAHPKGSSSTGDQEHGDEFGHLMEKDVTSGDREEEGPAPSRRSFLQGLGTGAAAAYGASRLLGKGGSMSAGDALDARVAERVLDWHMRLAMRQAPIAFDREEADTHSETMRIVPKLIQKIRAGKPVEDVKDLQQLWWAAEQVADPKRYEADEMSDYYAVPFPSGMGDGARKVAEWAAARGGAVDRRAM